MSATVPNSRYDVVGIATSGGGLVALRTLLGALPADFPAAVLAVQHRARVACDYLPELLARHCALPVGHAYHGAPIHPGRVLIAPPGRHLELGPNGQAIVERRDAVHFCCPAADVLFESLACHAPGRVIACVLTGSGSDSAAGVRAVRAAGGYVIAQSPRTAEFPGMPQAAIETGCVDIVLSLADIAFALCRLTAAEESAA